MKPAHPVLLLAAAGVSLLALTAPARAELPSFLRTENSHVRDGNDKLGKGDAKGALESYALAARELPEAPGVSLDRGLALLKSGELAKARESFLTATAPGAPAPLRADAYRNLALAFYREGDKLSGEKKHKEAQQMFRESVDAGKRSLRLRPGDADTAWNLELAARRIREEEQKQKEEEEKNEQENKDQDKQPDDQKKDDSQNQDQQPNQDQNQQDQSKQDEQKQDEQKPNDPPEQKQQDQQQANKDPQKPPEQPQEGQESGKEEPGEAKESQLPVEAEQALDALSDSEENFERYRARQRASRERRAPEKDW